jgi:hypothetical protein
MFNSKKKTLFMEKEKKTSVFVNAAKNIAAEDVSGNGARKFNTTGSVLVDQFAKIGSYKKPRDYAEVERDMIVLFAEDARSAIAFTLYCRLITRKCKMSNGEQTNEVQRGAGLKHESLMRMMWLQINHSELFWKNIYLFIAAGSWNDLIQMLSYDLQYHGWPDKKLQWDIFFTFIAEGLSDDLQVNLIKKYLPQIKANSACKTVEAQADNIIAKWLCSKLFGGKEGSGVLKQNYNTYKQYRKLKTSGTAHQWQQLISQGKHKSIDFGKIHGRALSLLVQSKYLSNQGLQGKYQTWIAGQPIAKFTGYPHELTAKITHSAEKYQTDTINKQWDGLLQLAGGLAGEYIVVKDTSESMNSMAYGTNVSSYHIAKTLSIFFAQMLKGQFAGTYIDFASTAILRTLTGKNVTELWRTETRIASANTNFLAVADLLCIIKQKGFREEDFPKGIICISDGEFDSTKMYDTTNINAFKYKLHQVGFSKHFVNNFSFVFWDIRNTFYGNRKTTFESKSTEKNVFYYGGYDPSVITFLTGSKSNDKKPQTAEDVVDIALNQELMQYISL